MTKVDLELISDADMYIFLEKGTRRGVSYISNIHSKGNNKCLNSYYPKQESKYVIYLGYLFLDIYFVIKIRQWNFVHFISSYSMIFTLNSI